MGFDYKKKDNETDLAFIFRLGEAKSLGLIDDTWEELADIFNKELHGNKKEFGESAYRKKYSIMKEAKDDVFSFGTDMISSNECDELLKLRFELEKERVKMRDERNELRRIIREEARNESFEDLIRRVISESDIKPLEYVKSNDVRETYDKDMLIPLFDLHYGLFINNNFNQFNDDIFRRRLIEYINSIKHIQDLYKCKDAYVVLSEICSGVIHTRLRIENNQNIIEQFLNVSSHIATFLAIIAEFFDNIYVYVAPGNHSRVFQKKEENAKGENFENLALPFLEAKLQNILNIHFVYNTVEESIAFFNIRGKKVIAVHGDLDTPGNISKHISDLFGIIPDIVLQGHMHTNQYQNLNGNVEFIQSGCFSGADNYCIQNRLNNKPGQMISIINECGIECLYPITFNI